jgi:aminoglycoside 3-N-acetyltransferase I
MEYPTDAAIHVVTAGRNDLSHIFDILIADAEEHGRSASAAVREFEESLRHFDFLSSDSFWILIALYQGKAAGYLSAARIPKGDPRKAFIFVDELWVLEAYRRRGIATALMNEIHRIGVEIGACGIRLITGIDNDPARSFYQVLGFSQQESVFCQRVTAQP